jgi:hypothetical protein
MKQPSADKIRKGDKFLHDGRTYTVTAVRTNHCTLTDEAGNACGSPMHAIQLLLRHGRMSRVQP